MVTPSSQSKGQEQEGNTPGKKRDSSEIEDSNNGTCNSSDMKKPRIVAGEEIIEGDEDNRQAPSHSPAKGQMEEIKARIKRYLEVMSVGQSRSTYIVINSVLSVLLLHVYEIRELSMFWLFQTSTKTTSLFSGEQKPEVRRGRADGQKSSRKLPRV